VTKALAAIDDVAAKEECDKILDYALQPDQGCRESHVHYPITSLKKRCETSCRKELNNKKLKLMKKSKRGRISEKALKDSEIRYFKYQINPHFMFNVLNTSYVCHHLKKLKKPRVELSVREMPDTSLKIDKMLPVGRNRPDRKISQHSVIRFGDRLNFIQNRRSIYNESFLP
jgi:hypothetical protein